MVERTKQIQKVTIVYYVCALVVFAILFGAFCLKGQEKAEVSIVMMGDSIMGENRDVTSIPVVLGGLMGEEIVNCALGGTSMGRLNREGVPAYTKDCLTMHSLAQSIVTSDFGPQQTVRSRENGTQYFEPTVNSLEQIDFETVELLFIGHGMNDYQVGIPIENKEDAYDVYTFTGALRSSVEMLQRAYPDLRIVLVTPTYSWYINEDGTGETCEERDFGGGILEAYVDAEIALGESLGIEVIDLYHDFYPHEQWNDWVVYTRDGVHPNEAGCKLIAEKIYQMMR